MKSDFLKKPVVAGLIGAVIGLIVGLIWAWVIQPVEWTNLPPASLDPSYQEQYVRMAIDSYRVDPNDALAKARFQGLGAAGPTVLGYIKNNPAGQDANAITAFMNVVEPGGVVPTPATGGSTTPGTGSTAGKGGSLTVVVIIGAIVAFIILGFVIFRYLIPLFRNTSSGAPSAARRAQDITSQTELTDYEAMGEEPPIAQFVTTYVLGDDLFDDSFSIDSPSGEFLGECGIGISETIGVGEPKKVQAFEVWLFDKNDIQTVTKVLMSTHAFNDVATFQRLQAKGEPFMVERGKQVVLETAALQLVATVSDMQFGQGALPESSYFDRLTLEIAVWPKVTAPA
ncbi:MAG TPA: hypothetical protein VMC09_05560 [Anaerolineales bacterium]|nr:hypothetical protein [Anaerolineales bacterium]